MRIAGAVETKLARHTEGSIAAVGNWRIRLANALAIRGYATVDLRTIDRAPFVPLNEALDRAERDFPSIVSPSWQSIAQHLLTLKVLGIETVALRARDKRLLMVVERLSPDSLDIEEASGYHNVLQQWADALSDMLPPPRLTDEEAKRAERVGDWVGKYTDQAAIGKMAAKLISVIAASRGQGCCITVHPVGSAPQTFVDAWQKTDLTRESFSKPRIQCANYLWIHNNGHVVPGGAGGLENPMDWNFEPQFHELSAALAQVSDR